MTIPLHQKIRNIRDTLNMSRKEFSNETGISARTLEAIENKGSTPRGDVLEKISLIWPEYAYWILTSKTDYPSHISPDQKKEIDAIKNLESSGYEITKLRK